MVKETKQFLWMEHTGLPARLRQECRQMGDYVTEFYEVMSDMAKGCISPGTRSWKYWLRWVSGEFRKHKRMPAGRLDCGTLCCRELCIKARVVHKLYQKNQKGIKIHWKVSNAKAIPSVKALERQWLRLWEKFIWWLLLIATFSPLAFVVT